MNINGGEFYLLINDGLKDGYFEVGKNSVKTKSFIRCNVSIIPIGKQSSVCRFSLSSYLVATRPKPISLFRWTKSWSL